MKNNFLILGDGDTFGINGSFKAPEKRFNISLSKVKTKFCLSLHYNIDNNYLFVNGKEVYIFKPSNKNNNFSSQLCLGTMCNKFDCVDLKEVSFKENVYGFSVDYDALDKSNILKIHKY